MNEKGLSGTDVKERIPSVTEKHADRAGHEKIRRGKLRTTMLLQAITNSHSLAPDCIKAMIVMAIISQSFAHS